MHITQFGAYTFPAEQIDLTETAGASRRGATSALGGMGGGWDDLGSGPDPLAEDMVSKTLTLEGVGETDQAKKESLRTQFDALLAGLMKSPNDYNQGVRLLLAAMPNGDTRGTWAKCVECRARWEYYNVNMGWLPVSILWRRSWPLWEKINPYPAEIHALYLGDHLGTLAQTGAIGDYDMGASQGATVVQQAMSNGLQGGLTVAGNARQPNVVIELDGQITNPRLTNRSNGHYFEYAGTLAAGDRLVVRPAQCTARLNGALVPLTIGTANGQILPWVVEGKTLTHPNFFILTGSGTISGTLRIYAPAAYY